MEVVELVGEIRAHEMSVLDILEEATPSNLLLSKPRQRRTQSSR
jgi:hypothetical protein